MKVIHTIMDVSKPTSLSSSLYGDDWKFSVKNFYRLLFDRVCSPVCMVITGDLYEKHGNG